ncbi:sodium:calcium antiporter [Indioceanicola profundi]|uniref:sodium:calcium antiporter n=1 Tax=Indioceanicola profundi TaxID=2220096 RepID=UPI000E6ACE86|nr:sodium:calcium exchanger [Indioceanicola profundi]
MGWAIWVPVLLAAVWAAHWGAEHLSNPLKKLRKQWGFSVAAGGSFIGLAAAAPEIGINTVSAMRGVADIGLGVMLGSNIIAIPLMVIVAYIATRSRDVGGEKGHEQHLREHLLAVDRSAVTVQAIPYLVILLIVAILTLPVPGRGLQPIDGWIMLLVYLAYLAQALLRGREKGKKVQWKRREVGLAAAGIGALVVGAFFTVLATENIVRGLGLSPVVGGLFITAPIAALPEVFATWSVAKSGQITSAVTSVIGDHAVTMTVAFLPLALVTLPIQDLQLYKVNLVFVALVPLLYAVFIHFGGSQHGFRQWQVVALVAVGLLWIATVVFWVRPA